MSIKLLALFLLLAVNAKAELQYRGFSSFAAMHPRYPCRRFLTISSYAKHPAMTVLWSTFGEDTDCIERFLGKFRGRKHLLQIHMLNGPCKRNGNCCGVDKKPHLMERLWQVRNFLGEKTNKNTKVIISTSLEDNFTSKEYLRVRKKIEGVLPYEISRNPMVPNSSFYPHFLELHSKKPVIGGGRCIFNPDGVEWGVSKSPFRAMPHCYAVFIWTERGQGIGGEGFTCPRSRDFRISSREVMMYGKMMKG